MERDVALKAVRTVTRQSDRRRSALDECTAALAVTVSSAGLAIALATLIFVGPLSPGLPRAVPNMLIAGGLLTAAVGWFSGIRPSLSILQDGPAIVLVTIAASLAATTTGDPVVNVLVALTVSGLAVGVTMIVVGRLGGGNVVRFFPATVINGFIAGTGWLLFKGGFDVMVDQTLRLSDVPDLFTPSVATFWIPGLALGLVVVALGESGRIPPVVVGSSVLLATVLFFFVAAIVSSIAEAEANNWFIGPFPDGSGASPISMDELRGADWSGLGQQTGSFLALIAVSVVAILLNLSSLETLTGQRLDYRRELQVTGVVNVLVAPLSPVTGFYGLGDTVLAQKMGARTRAVPIAVGGMSVVAGLFGTRLIAFTPRVIAGGLLIAVGLGLLFGWATTLSTTTSRSERGLSISILVLIGGVGILEGITLGLVAACLIFVVRYSRIDPIKREIRASQLPSRVVRSAADTARLASVSDQILAIQLTGYQFFGSFAAVVERIERSSEAAPTAFVIIDFRHVTGIDSSGFSRLHRLINDLAERGTTVLLSDIEGYLPGGPESSPLRFAGLDFAIEHAEELLLRATEAGVDEAASPFQNLSPELQDALTVRSVRAGDIVIEQDTGEHAGAEQESDERSLDADASLFLVISGDLAVIRLNDDGTAHRLRRIGSGTVIGERSVLLGEPRSARVSAETDGELLEITAVAYRRLQDEDPSVALELQNVLLAELSRRSVSLSEQLSQALR